MRQISSEQVSELRRIRISTDGGEQLRYAPIEIRGSFEFDIASVCAGDLDEVLVGLDRAAGQQVKALVGGMVERLDAVTAATGNQVDAGGRSLSHELLFELLEKMEVSFDENGQAELAFVAAPDVARKIAALPEMTAEQQGRFDEIMARKRQEHESRQRRRRLRVDGPGQ